MPNGLSLGLFAVELAFGMNTLLMGSGRYVSDPIFEADLPPEQYAYRPGRNAQQAVIEVEEMLFRGHPEVVDADLADYGHQIRGRGVVSVLRPSAVGRQPRPRLHAAGSGAPDGELLTAGDPTGDRSCEEQSMQVRVGASEQNAGAGDP
jgi:hypothetical protein